MERKSKVAVNFSITWQDYHRIRLGGADESSAMEYKQFIIKLFEREPGKWRATVRRSDGKPLMVSGRGRVKLSEFVTGVDAVTAEAVLLAAMAAIDAGAFSRKVGGRV